MKLFKLIALLLIAAGAAFAAALGEEPDFALEREAVFEAVWGHIDRTYYDPEFAGKDWSAIGERYRLRLTEVSDQAQLRALLQKMLFELEESHFAIVPASLADLAGGSGSGGYAGLDLTFVGDEVAAYRVERDGPAWSAGIRPGDRIRSVRQRAVASLFEEVRQSDLPDHLADVMGLQLVSESFSGRPGDKVTGSAVDPAGAERSFEIELRRYEGRMGERIGNLGPAPLAFEASAAQGEIAYLRFSLWFPSVMPDIRSFVGSLEGKATGLIVDLRGNPGGIGLLAGGLGGMLLSEQTVFGTISLREGHLNIVAFPQQKAFTGPVAILLDRGSASTSEIFALGMQEAGRAQVFGQRSAGAALPSTLINLPNGDLLQSVLGAFHTPAGASLEGLGVAPDFPVELSLVDLSEGSDSVVSAASRWIESVLSSSE